MFYILISVRFFGLMYYLFCLLWSIISCDLFDLTHALRLGILLINKRHSVASACEERPILDSSLVRIGMGCRGEIFAKSIV